MTLVSRLAAAAAAVSLLGPAGAIRGQGRRPMTLVDIAGLPRALDPQLSPDGRSLVYALSHADWKANRPVWQIWRQPVGGGGAVQLTFGEGGIAPGFTRWSPDGGSLLFLRYGQLQLMPANGGEARALTHHATTPTFPSWTPDGRAVYFLATDARSAEDRDRERLRDDVYAYEENFRQRHLWKVSVAAGAEAAITTGDFSVGSYRLSADGRRIAFARAPSPLVADAFRSEVWTMDADGGSGRAATSNQIEESDPELSPDGRQVLFLAAADARLAPYYNQNLFVAPVEGGTPRPVVDDCPYEIDRAIWAADGRSIIAVANMGVHSEVIRVDVAAGTFRLLTSGEHAIPPAPAPAFSFEPRAGRLAFLFDEPSRFGEAYTLRLDGGTAERVTHVYDTLAATFALPRQERVEWRGADGERVEGLLFLPDGFDPRTRYPLVVQMHGGPAESDKFGAGAGLFQSYFPVLAARGYLVFRPNYRGSSGYGNAAYRDVVGHYFNNMPLDVLAGVDALAARGFVDTDQLVLMGWSAGGHLANKLITVTTRFKAASSGAGAANWISMFAQTDDRSRRAVWFGGTPWQKDAPIDAYWNSSPIKDVANARTPTLFFVGENDPRVPMPQSIEMWRALREQGVATRLYAAPREGHQWGELRHLLFKANAELEWFEKYARGRGYTWEQAP
jgi:dipeptidyl aminopeptidase/acylaminoacyl peptidase